VGDAVHPVFRSVVSDLEVDLTRGRVRFRGEWYPVPRLDMELRGSGPVENFAWRLVYLAYHARDHAAVQGMLSGGVPPRPLRLLEDRAFADAVADLVRHRTDEPGWSLRNGGSRLVAVKDGLTVQVGPEDLAGPTTGPLPRQVVLRVPAVQRYVAPGWLHVGGRRRPDHPDRVLRVYQPAGTTDDALRAVGFWVDVLGESCPAFHLKVANNPRAQQRADSLVVYLPVEDGTAVSAAVGRAVRENPLARTPRPGPGFALDLGGNVFVAFEPSPVGGLVSYGQFCAQAAVDLVLGRPVTRPGWSLAAPWAFGPQDVALLDGIRTAVQEPAGVLR
jgi:hypothetical protein